MSTSIFAQSLSTTVKTPPSSLEDADHPVISEDEERGIGVVVRVRPLSTQELANSSIGQCIQCLKQSIVIGGGSAGNPVAKGLGSAKGSLKPRQFSVDKVYHQHSSQKQLYDECCRSIVAGLFEGTNGAILAYGATGSGKTHTMFGGPMSSAGIVYQAVHDIFEEKMVLEEEEGKKVEVKCSFVEIYNENVFDLLAPPKKSFHTRTLSGTAEIAQNSSMNNIEMKVAPWVNGRPALPVRERKQSEGETACNPEPLYIPGLTYVYPNSAEEFAQAIEKGRSNRFVACTAANAQSSRSHAIITVEVHVSGGMDDRGRPCPGTIARIRMCDLAGSERAASSSNSGIRLREGGNINRSLLALGSVVQSLLQRRQTPSSPQRQVFVPYRGSCLTRLLKDSIGGTCRTQMIFCLNPSTKQQEESVNTMLFAMKASQIQVTAYRNVYTVNSETVAKSQELLIDELRQQISLYEEELLKLGVNPSESLSRKFLGGGSRITSCAPRQDSVGEDFGLSRPDNHSVLSSSLDIVDISENRSVGARGSLGVDYPSQSRSPRDPSPQPVKASSLRRRKTVSMDMASPQFIEVETKLRDLMSEKEAQYWKNREAKERIVARDLQLRELQWKLARFLASNELGVRLRGDPRTTSGGTVATPVGVAGMRNTIASVESEQNEAKKEAECSLMDIDKVERQIEAIRNDLPREKQQGVIELLFENMKLRQNCTEAEHLASDYHQECRQTKARINEYQEALSVCVSALHSVIPHLSHNSTAMTDAKLALLYAHLPHASTEDMVQVFETSLKADSTPPLVPSGCGGASSSPNKRHQVSHSGDDLFSAFQDLEQSYHSHVWSSPGRTRVRPLWESEKRPEGLGQEVLAPSEWTAESALNVASPPKMTLSQATVSPVQIGAVGATAQAEVTSLVRTPEKAAERQKPASRSAPNPHSGSSPAKDGVKKPMHFTRFYSSTAHLSPSTGASSSPSVRPPNVTPTRRRREVDSKGDHHTTVGVPHTTSTTPQHTRPGAASPIRYNNTSKPNNERPRPATAAPFLAQRHSLRGSISRAHPTPQPHGNGNMSGVSPPRGNTFMLLSSGSHLHPSVEEGGAPTQSPNQANRSRIRMRGDPSPTNHLSSAHSTVAAGSVQSAFQRSVHPPSIHPLPAKVVKTPMPAPSIPGFSTVVPPQPRATPIILKKAPKRMTPEAPPLPEKEEEEKNNWGTFSPLVAEISPVSARSGKWCRSPSYPRSPQGVEATVSGEHPVDDMQVSRSTFSEAEDELGELSSTFSQFTPRDALCGTVRP